MTITDAEEVRLQTIELYLGTLRDTIDNLASKEQIRQLLLLKQQQVAILVSKVATLEAQLVALTAQFS